MEKKLLSVPTEIGRFNTNKWWRNSPGNNIINVTISQLPENIYKKDYSTQYISEFGAMRFNHKRAEKQVYFNSVDQDFFYFALNLGDQFTTKQNFTQRSLSGLIPYFLPHI